MYRMGRIKNFRNKLKKLLKELCSVVAPVGLSHLIVSKIKVIIGIKKLKAFFILNSLLKLSQKAFFLVMCYGAGCIMFVGIIYSPSASWRTPSLSTVFSMWLLLWVL